MDSEDKKNLMWYLGIVLGGIVGGAGGYCIGLAIQHFCK